MNLSEPFIRRPVATSLIMSALALVGITAFPFLPVAPLPQVDFPTVQVTATLAGASAETMASSVAAPLERQFGQISGVTQMTSLSSLGVSQVVIQFDLNRNIDLAAQDVQAAITAASKFLPQAMTQPPNYRKVNPADAPIMMLWAHSDTLPLTTVHDYLDNFFIQALSQVPGVAQASIIGDQKPSIRVQVDPAKLAAIGLTLEEVRAKLVSATSNAAKGTIFTPKVGYTIAANDQIAEAEPFNDVILAYRDGAALRVRDVGQAVVEATSRYVAGFPNNKPGMLLSIRKQPGANVIDTVERIKAQLPKLTANIPAAMKVDTLLDRTVTIRASVHDVEFTLVLTIVLVVLVVLVFLRSFWATFIPGITVVLALLGSFAAMYVLNFSLDNISLMALTIAVGFVVDDAIVVVENIYRHVEDGMTPFEAALKGSREIAFTVLSISVSLVAVFIPLLLMGGIIGRVFREFALTVTASIAVSALVSLTLAPDAVRALHAAENRRAWAALSPHRGRLRRHAGGLPAHARCGAAPSGDHARRVLRDRRRHRRHGHSNSQGLFPDPGHRPDFRRLRGVAGGVALRDDAPAAGARRDHPARSRRAGDGIADRLHRQPQPRQYRRLHHRAQAARRAQSVGAPDHRPAAAAIRPGPGRQRVPAADPGHQCGRPPRPRQLPVHAAGCQHRRADRVVAEDAGEAAHPAGARRRHRAIFSPMRRSSSSPSTATRPLASASRRR